MWDIEHFYDQAANGYVQFWGTNISFQSGSLLHGVKGSSSKHKSELNKTRTNIVAC